MYKMSEGQFLTLEKMKGNKEEFKNKIYKIERDPENNQIKVISKRRSHKGKGFSIPYYEELKSVNDEIVQKFLNCCYITSIYKYL